MRRVITLAKRLQLAERDTGSCCRKHRGKRSVRAHKGFATRDRRDETLSPIACELHGNTRDDRTYDWVRWPIKHKRRAAISGAGKDAHILRTFFKCRVFCCQSSRTYSRAIGRRAEKGFARGRKNSGGATQQFSLPSGLLHTQRIKRTLQFNDSTEGPDCGLDCNGCSKAHLIVAPQTEH